MSKIVVTRALVDEFEASVDSVVALLEAIDETSVSTILLGEADDHPDAGIRVMAFATWYTAKYGLPT